MTFALGRSLLNWDLILAALFLWITLFFAARSAKETAFIILSADFPFLASLTATSRPLSVALFTKVLFLLPRRALLAVLVTGIFRL